MAYGKSRGKFVNNGTEAKCGHRCRQESVATETHGNSLLLLLLSQ